MKRKEKHNKQGDRDLFNARDLCQVAVATAVICVCSWLAFPFFGIPITLQTLAVCLISALLGIKKAMLSLLVYLCLGAVGVPVFAGFSGGITHLLSPTGGFLIGFLCVPLFAPFMKNGFWQICLFMLIGVFGCYAFGIAWFSYAWLKGSFMKSLIAFILPCLPFDILKICLSAFLARRLQDIIKA